MLASMVGRTSWNGQPLLTSGKKLVVTHKQGEATCATWRHEARKDWNEHDIRKTVANEADNLDHAQRLLGHQDAKTTSSTYRIGRPETVRVLINSEKL